ncbi:MAG: hypothetical protein II971_02145 [Firmicutes bacterium]|nr:hypothetical protein [Bacillota bacterium]
MQTIDKKTSSDRARTAKALEEYWDRSSQNYEERHELANTPLWQEMLRSFADIPVEPFSFANTSAENILVTFRNAGVADISLHHMKGCHMVRSDKENWYAFVGSKH